ncbi:unnamed protein product [Protopolystoma xenopodis]|uniref:Uncharacterized protein n=1 Tax=Protopolystoma xenopodis TaxID=117903 RepID=A0A448WU37_9PLAT|nr:unnamed protein product [Protopolystoma xenopodis]
MSACPVVDGEARFGSILHRTGLISLASLRVSNPCLLSTAGPHLFTTLSYDQVAPCTFMFPQLYLYVSISASLSLSPSLSASFFAQTHAPFASLIGPSEWD